MGQILSVNKLGDAGVNLDLEAHELPVEVFTNGINYRLVDGHIECFNGSTLLYTSTSSINAAFVDFVQSGANQFYFVAGRDKVMVFDGTIWSNITSVDMTANPLAPDGEYLWTGAKLGKIPIINNPNHYPEYWSPQQTSQVMQPLLFKAGSTWKAMGYKAKVMRAHKQFLFALNLTEGASQLENSYRWSHPADVNGLPPSWDEADLSFIAGKAQIRGNNGVIVDGLSMRDAFVIYSSNAITVLDYVGGEFIFNAREISNTYGLLTANCVAEAKGLHYFLSDGDILVNDGQNIESILHRQLRKRIAKSLSSSYYSRSFAIKNKITKEIWFCLVEEGATLPTFAIIYNWNDKTISQRDLDQKYSSMISAPVLTVNKNWSTITGLWSDNSPDKWGDSSTSPFSYTVLGVAPGTSSIYDMQQNVSASTTSVTIPDWSVSGTWAAPPVVKWDDSIISSTYESNLPFDTELERVSFTIADHVGVTSIQRIYPHIISQGSVYIQLGSQDFVGAPVRWRPEVMFTPSTQRKLDIRTTGKLHSWRVRSIGTDTFKLSGFNLEYVQNGVR